MVIHRARLYYLKNRYTILLTGMAFILLTSLFLQILLLQKSLYQSKDNENTLKGISCILLIQPQDRTQEKINKCIDRNSGAKPEGQGFKFNPPDLDSETDKESQKTTPNNVIALPESITPSSPIIIREKPKPQPEETLDPVAPIIREIETRLSPITGALQCRIVGTSIWQEGNNCK
jgi:hypothetical protein